ncbi:hypothetical protein SHIRM173S_11972 [Streptomyces hirsutus]
MPRALDGADPAQRGEGRLTARTLRLSPTVIGKVTAVRTDAHPCERLRGVAVHDPGQAVFQAPDLFGELPDSVGPAGSA